MNKTRRWLATLLCSIVLPVVASTAGTETITPEANRRSEEQTFLTYPEWFLVYSPAEFADYAKSDQPPSGFPFLGHIGQIWTGYAKVTDTTRSYPFNYGYHVMIVVIATSTTIEYGLRSLYENIIGRFGELTANEHKTAEEQYAAKIAKDYVDFIRVLPWYEYDFSGALGGLWRDTGYGGDNQIRKWERKFALTTEYGFKAIYGGIIKIGTKMSYGTEPLNTVVMIDRAPTLPAEMKDYQVIKTLPDGQILASLPRYDAFKHYADVIAGSGGNFVEIAGNGSKAQLLVTFLAPKEWQADLPEKRVLFEQPILTQPDRKRVAIATSVGQLANILRSLHTQKDCQLEHVYDY